MPTGLGSVSPGNIGISPDRRSQERVLVDDMERRVREEVRVGIQPVLTAIENVFDAQHHANESMRNNIEVILAAHQATLIAEVDIQNKVMADYFDAVEERLTSLERSTLIGWLKWKWSVWFGD